MLNGRFGFRWFAHKGRRFQLFQAIPRPFNQSNHCKQFLAIRSRSKPSRAISSHFKLFQSISNNFQQFDDFKAILSHFKPYQAMSSYLKFFPRNFNQFEAVSSYFEPFQAFPNHFKAVNQSSSNPFKSDQIQSILPHLP